MIEMGSTRLRAALIALACLFVASCSQTASSTYGGRIGANVADKQRAAKIEAARERARRKREAEKEAFLQKRRAARDRRLGRKTTTRRTARRTAKTTRRTAKATSRSRRASRKRVRLNKKTGATRRVARKAKTKRIRGRTKKVTSAFVGKPRGMRINAPWKCVPGRLKRVLNQISKRWGPVTINSTARSRRHNRLVGGKRRSYHLRCQAVDFRVRGSSRGLLRWLARNPSVGGYKRYRSGFFHIDTGPKRTW